ncbi:MULTISPECIES: hypothetical protein [Pseudomonas]|uniref:Uncharacterized protein n=1 Tax=Pseudomonas azadiae TaxID=2843612 RepID=A0ABS6NUT7_9PSED|nr:MULTISPECIES: hypothetical protein [Pseudomonas]MBV4451978.1 hypothetical protein [Pseudomonas azadiae]NMF38845.1 hypothetical protein [Pseudomonas sp. SWRI 103]
MSNKDLNELIHRSNKQTTLATGTIDITKNTGQLQLPDPKRHDFEKHMGNDFFETTWIARRVGVDSQTYNYQAIVITFKDKCLDGPLQVSNFGDVTVTWALVINNIIRSWHAESGTLNLTSNRTLGQERIHGDFKDCEMVNQHDTTQRFFMAGTYDLKDVSIIT